VVLSVKGDLDALSVSEFRQATAQHRESPRLIIEFGSTYIGSAGLSPLVEIVRRTPQQKEDAAFVCTPRISELLTGAGFDRVRGSLQQC
jgi:anti-anti-sigma regulatory factor